MGCQGIRQHLRSGKDFLAWLHGLHANHEQVHEHPDLGDDRHDDNVRVDLITEVGDQERHEQVHQVADSGPR